MDPDPDPQTPDPDAQAPSGNDAPRPHGVGLPGPADAPLPGGTPEAVAAWPLRESVDTPPAQRRSGPGVRRRVAGGVVAAVAAAGTFVALTRPDAALTAGAVSGVAPSGEVGTSGATPPDSAGLVVPPSSEPLATGRVGFRLTTPRVVGTDHALHTVVGMPGETIPLALAGIAAPALTTSDGRVERTADGWAWTLPDAPGLARLTVADGATRQTQQVQALVMTPYDGSGRIGGYEIGAYANDPDPTRPRPRGFVELPASMEDVPVSAHFRLGDFACKQPGTPRFLMLDERLLVKLETLLVRVRAEGIPATRFVVMSGYRTPHYNASIGNETSRSAHLYGQAADIYIDEDGDGSMDDVTGDGQVTRADAERLAAIASPLDDDPRFVGGLGIYSPAPHRGPFIHVDTRGRRSRW